MAPRLFTKILKPIFAWFRHQGYRCSYYIDDSINMNRDNRDKTVCHSTTCTMANTMESLGFLINKGKSFQRIVYFGYIIDSLQFKVFLPDKKLKKIINTAKLFLSSETDVIRLLASFIGFIINAFHAVLEAPLHYRTLEREKCAGLGSSKDYEHKIKLSPHSRLQIRWWLDNVDKKNGKPIRPEKPTVFIQTDASLVGWGAFDLKSCVSDGGRWTEAEGNFPINYLELLAIFHALRAFCSEMTNVHVSIQSDSTCAIAYVNNMVGIGSLIMDLLASELWQWCLQKDIFISASFILGIFNVDADFNSRNFSDSTEWMINKRIMMVLYRSPEQTALQTYC